MCDVDIDGVISTPDAPSIYDIPKVLHREELDAYVVRRLNLPFRDVDWTEWDDLLRRVHEPQETVRIALVGKYIDLSDAYLSVAEALRAGGFRHHAKVEIRWVASDDCETDASAAAGARRRARRADPRRVRHPRHRGQDRRHQVRPQAAASRCSGCASACSASSSRRPARSASTEANSAEFDPDTPDPVISTMADQQRHRRRRGRPRRHHAPRRLSRGAGTGFDRGAGLSRRPRCPSGTGTATRSTTPTATGSPRAGCGSRAPRRTGTSSSSSSTTPTVHPFLVGTQAHPELKSRPTRPHPLFVAFIGAALDYKAAERLPVETRRRNGAERRRARAARARAPWLTTTSTTVDSETLYVGKIFALRADEVRHAGRPHRTPRGGRALRRRRHRRARRRATTSSLIHQYRHPVGRRLWELPAGLLDIGGEAAAPDRRPRTRGGSRAGRRATGACWSTSISAPGFSDECVRVYLATGLTDVGRPEAHDEEADLTVKRFPLADAVEMVLSGEIVNSLAVAGHSGRPRPSTGTCRRCAPVDAPWPDRPTRFARAAGQRVTTARVRRRSGRPAPGLPRPPHHRARGGRQHAELLPARPAPLRRTPDGPRDRRLGDGHRGPTSATSWWRCDAGDPDTGRRAAVGGVGGARADRGPRAAPLRRRRGTHRPSTSPARSSRRPRAAGCPRASASTRCVALLDGAGGDSETDGPLTLRNRALLEVLYSTGARISEAVGLDVDDVDTQSRSVLLRGKGGKQRLVPIGRPAVSALDAYLVRGRPDLARRGKGTPGDLPQRPRRPAVPAERLAGAAGRRRTGRASPRRCHRTRCGTRSRPTCSRAAPTSASCRNCSATRR